tara:strand:- start:2301 stop:3020 length:720 start_codon:yes stop_codon:yes gene_type:complete
MAYTYLDLTNEVLARFNEVALTPANFLTSRGFQTQCKNAINDSYLYLNSRQFTWPFNHANKTETLVANQPRYSVPADAKWVDQDTFRISKDSSLGAQGGVLSVLDYKDYIEQHIDSEDNTATSSYPRYVVRTLDNNYLVYPMPNKAYELKYEYYKNTEVLVAATDVPVVPEQFRQTLVDGATAYGYQYRGESDQFGISFNRFEDGIKQMRIQLVNNDVYVRSTVIQRNSKLNLSGARLS